MIWFYRLNLFFIRFELAVAGSTGRQRDSIAQLLREEDYYEMMILLAWINRRT